MGKGSAGQGLVEASQRRGAAQPGRGIRHRGEGRWAAHRPTGIRELGSWTLAPGLHGAQRWWVWVEKGPGGRLGVKISRSRQRLYCTPPGPHKEACPCPCVQGARAAGRLHARWDTWLVHSVS